MTNHRHRRGVIGRYGCNASRIVDRPDDIAINDQIARAIIRGGYVERARRLAANRDEFGAAPLADLRGNVSRHRPGDPHAAGDEVSTNGIDCDAPRGIERRRIECLTRNASGRIGDAQRRAAGRQCIRDEPQTPGDVIDGAGGIACEVAIPVVVRGFRGSSGAGPTNLQAERIDPLPVRQREHLLMRDPQRGGRLHGVD